MGGTRIMVFQLRRLIQTGIIVLIGIIAVIALILVFTSKSNKPETALYNPGTYSAQIILHNKPVSVKVSVNANQIESIVLEELEETQEVFYPLFKPTLDTLAKEIIKKQTTNISSLPNAALTSQILIDAVNTALMKATVGAQ